MMQLRLIFYFLALTILASCAKKKDDTSAKLTQIYKNKLTAYGSKTSFKIAKLKKYGDRDTLIHPVEWYNDKLEFLKLLVETNYYNLEYRAAEASSKSKIASGFITQEIRITDPNFNYKKDKKRKYCDEDIIQLSKDFNATWPPEKVPTKTSEVTEYLLYKVDIIDYLLQNKCY